MLNDQVSNLWQWISLHLKFFAFVLLIKISCCESWNAKSSNWLSECMFSPHEIVAQIYLHKWGKNNKNGQSCKVFLINLLKVVEAVAGVAKRRRFIEALSPFFGRPIEADPVSTSDHVLLFVFLLVLELLINNQEPPGFLQESLCTWHLGCLQLFGMFARQSLCSVKNICWKLK